jgi:hypothetical protein
MEHDLEGKLASVRPAANWTAYAIQDCHLVARQAGPDAPMVRRVDVACIAGVLRPQANQARASQDIRIELAGHVVDIDQLIGLAGAMWPEKSGKLVQSHSNTAFSKAGQIEHENRTASISPNEES